MPTPTLNCFIMMVDRTMDFPPEMKAIRSLDSSRYFASGGYFERYQSRHPL